MEKSCFKSILIHHKRSTKFNDCLSLQVSWALTSQLYRLGSYDYTVTLGTVLSSWFQVMNFSEYKCGVPLSWLFFFSTSVGDVFHCFLLRGWYLLFYSRHNSLKRKVMLFVEKYSSGNTHHFINIWVSIHTLMKGTFTQDFYQVFYLQYLLYLTDILKLYLSGSMRKLLGNLTFIVYDLIRFLCCIMGKNFYIQIMMISPIC